MSGEILTMHPAAPYTRTAALVDNGVMLHYHPGLADGITILCRRDGEKGYATIAEDQPGPVVDARPKLDPLRPETRHYVAFLRYIHRDNTLITREVRVTLQ